MFIEENVFEDMSAKWQSSWLGLNGFLTATKQL